IWLFLGLHGCLKTPALTDTEATSEGDCPLGTVGCRCAAERSCEMGAICAQGRCVSFTPDETDSTDGPTTSASSDTGDDTDTGGCDPADGINSADCILQNANKPYCSEQGTCVDCTELTSCL